MSQYNINSNEASIPNEPSHSSKIERLKVILLTGLANMLEIYDFTLFAVMMPILVMEFFPSGNHDTNMIIGYLAFAVSFLIAPLGSLIWGYIGDKYGSFKIFKISLLFMAFPSLVIAFLPTFNEIGWVAPTLLIIFRIFQGFSSAGEILGSKIYAFEKLGKRYYLMASSVISAFGAVGVLLAMYAGSLISHYENPGAWRYPFFIGGVLILIIMFMRIFIDKQKRPHLRQQINIFSILHVLKMNPKAAINGFTLSAILGVFSYFMHAYLITLQTQNLNYSLAQAYENGKIGLLGTIIAACAVAISHKKFKEPLLNSLSKILIIMSFVSIPLYSMLLFKINILTQISLFSMGALLGIFAGISSVYVINSFSIRQRCRGALLVNAFGVAIFGGLTPLIMMSLAKLHIIMPALFLCMVFIISYKIIKRA